MAEWIEITNPIHGGPGWEFGTCLWSPIKDRGGSEAWKIMKKVHSSDTIYHLLKMHPKNNKEEYYFVGVSIVLNPAQVFNDPPPKPDRWGGMAPYYRIDLTGYRPLHHPVKVNKIFQVEKVNLISELKSRPAENFYELKKTGNLQVSLRYIASSGSIVTKILTGIMEMQGLDNQSLVNEGLSPSDSTPAYPDYSPPGSVVTTVIRKIRDTAMIRKIKDQFKNHCAICNYAVHLPSDRFYSEGHHVRPLASFHEGPDVKQNILILCPTHHAEFDYGSIAIDPIKGKIVHLDPNNEYAGREPAYSLAHLDPEFLKYHFSLIFKGEK